MRLAAKTAACACGKRIPVGQMKPLFTTDDARALPEALGRIRAELAGHEEEFQEALDAERAAAGTSGRRPGGTWGPRMREVALEVLRPLEEEGRGFRLAEAEHALEAAGLPVVPILEALQGENLLYEAVPGRYRLV